MAMETPYRKIMSAKAIAGKEYTGLRRIFGWLQGATAGASRAM
jgi:hypothetical protein